MIKAEVARNTAGQVVAFSVKNHGASHVCAAVSLLVINTVNSIEALTQAVFSCDHNPAGGFIAFALQTPREALQGRTAGLLLDAMHLGLVSVQEQYPKQLVVCEVATVPVASNGPYKQ